MTIQDLKDADVIQQAIDKAKNDPMRPLLVINCITYNHAPYLAQCLEGFVMQKTNFPFVALVHDDASLDGTAEILREYAEKYPDIIKPICDPTNRYSDKSLDLIMNEWINAYEPKYIAMCEGDDYWIDPLKLQKQVDFLDNNPEYGMCYTQCQYFYQDKKCLAPKPRGGVYESFEQLIKVNTIPTLTVLMRSNLQKKYTEEIKPTTKGWLMGDYPMWLWFAYNSKIKFLSYCTSVYRVLSSSASHFISIHRAIEFAHSVVDIQTFYYDLYTSDKSDEKYKKYITSLRIYALHDYKKNFFEIWKSGIKANPLWLLRFNTYKYILFFFMPLKLKERYKK